MKSRYFSMLRLSGAMILPALLTVCASAAEPSPVPDGWSSWRVNAVEDAPDWCCFDWIDGKAIPKVCDLDSRHMNYGGHDHESPSEMQIYALMENGQLRKVRALSVDCPVKSDGEIINLGSVTDDDSATWLADYIAPHSKISTHVLAAIAVHQGETARRQLTNTARHDDNLDNRKDAVFWMGQVRAAETADDIRDIMLNDASAKMRKHAAFSMSQTDLPERNAVLIEQGNNDTSADVRSQAWFWLAQIGAPETEDAIFAALRIESKRQVHDQLIFALSQLPEERALDALVAVIEDRQFSQRDRKQALFWMAQNESEQAVEYLDSLLALK